MAVVDQDGVQQLHITEVKAGGLASVKGTQMFMCIYRIYCVKNHANSCTFDNVSVNFVLAKAGL